MICKTAYYNSTASTYQALTQETRFVSYNIQHGFNGPAECVVILSDPTGSIMQKYDTGTDAVYVGPGKIMIQDPAPSPDDDTTNIVFYGRILKARHDTATNRVTLYCADWMSQLDDERIHYDFREDLDGSGLRQSELHADLTITDWSDMREPVETDGTDYYAYDGDMDWSASQFDGMYMVLTGGHAGVQNIGMGPSGISLSGALDDSPTFYESRYCWTDDTNATTASDDTAPSYKVYLEYKPIVTEGSLHSATTEMRIKLTYSLVDANGNGSIYAVHTNEATTYYLGTLDTSSSEIIKTTTFTVPLSLLPNILETDGTVEFVLTIPVTGGTQAVLKLYYAWLELDVTTTGTSAAIAISHTRKQYGDIDAAYMHDVDVGYTDETVDINDDGPGDVTLFPAALAVSDAFYFGFTAITNGILLTISQAGVYSSSTAWQYWDGDSWATLSVTDDTNKFKTAGTNFITWTPPSDWATTAVNGTTKYWVRLAVQNAIPPTTTVPLATQGWGFTGNGSVLKVGTDLDVSGLGLWEGCPYSIVKPIYSHLNALITDTTYGCPLVALTSSLESTSGYTTRHFIDRTRLEILREVCKMDKTVFYIALNDPTPTVIWKSTFNDGAPTAMTDTSVLSWTGGEYDFLPMYNEYHVMGIRIGDEQIYVASEDLGTDPGDDSQAKYGVNRTGVEAKSGTMSKYEAEELAKALVERDEDVNLFLQATLGGLSSLRLGDEVSITSTMLGLTAEKYVITHWTYDSKTYRTYIKLHPRSASTKGFVDRVVFGDHIRRLITDAKTQGLDNFHSDLTTHEWS